MNPFSAIILGIIQGFTEFLPVSSSGHLVLAQSLIPSFAQPGVLFDVNLHLATTLAVIYYYRKTILKLSLDYIFLIIIATIPAAVFGILFRGFLESLFSNLVIDGITLIITAFLCYFTDKFWAKRETISRLDAFLVGIAQAIAIVPGISRSGSTIFAATSLGIDREKAAQFSFLISVPAVLGAGFVEFLTHTGNSENIQFGPYALGFLASFVTAIFAIKIVMDFLVSRQFKYFAFYVAIVGVVAIVIGLN